MITRGRRFILRPLFIGILIFMTTWAKWTFVALILLAGGTLLWWTSRLAPEALPVGTATTTSSDMIEVMAPLEGALVTSPLTVFGKARGNWYFEASFPVRILDGNGRELGVVAAQAREDWMTTEFVPFVGTLTFATSTTATGTLIFEKDNPSGLPEHDAEIRVPVRFK